MSETGDLSDPEIQIIREEIVTLSVFGTVGRVGDFLQGFVYRKSVFELTPVRKIYVILVEKATLKLFSESVVVVILENCFGNVLVIRVEESVGRERVAFSGELRAFDLFLPKVNDLL